MRQSPEADRDGVEPCVGATRSSRSRGPEQAFASGQATHREKIAAITGGEFRSFE
jgi:hypothetical protein